MEGLEVRFISFADHVPAPPSAHTRRRLNFLGHGSSSSKALFLSYLFLESFLKRSIAHARWPLSCPSTTLHTRSQHTTGTRARRGTLSVSLNLTTSICVCIYQESRPCRLIRKTCQFILSLSSSEPLLSYIYIYLFFFASSSKSFLNWDKEKRGNTKPTPAARQKARKMNQGENFHLFQSFFFFFFEINYLFIYLCVSFG